MAPTPMTSPSRHLASLRDIFQLPREILSQVEDHLLSHHHFVPLRDAPAEPLSLPPSSTLSAVKRQYTTIALPQTYAGLRDPPSPGTVVGIVLGSVAGFILVVWLLWTLANFGGGRSGGLQAESIEIVRDGRRGTHTHSSRRSHRSRRERVEVRERSRSHSPLPPVHRGSIIVEERRTSVPPAPRVERERETVIVEERHREPRVEGDDMVEVIEEGSGSVSTEPPRRHESRRSSRRHSGFRQVDPNRFGGGDYPQHRVRRDRSLSSRG